MLRVFDVTEQHQLRGVLLFGVREALLIQRVRCAKSLGAREPLLQVAIAHGAPPIFCERDGADGIGRTMWTCGAERP